MNTVMIFFYFFRFSELSEYNFFELVLIFLLIKKKNNKMFNVKLNAFLVIISYGTDVKRCMRRGGDENWSL